MHTPQTIAAISTPLGIGGIGIVRLSGADALPIAQKIFRSFSGQALSCTPGYTSLLGRIHGPDGEIDEAIAFVYRAPKSYTGEDVVELSCHGGLWLVQCVLQLCVDAGALPAGAGEFTMRAFQNGKLSLAQAESVADLLHAQSTAALRVALAGRDGALATQINAIAAQLTAESAHLAAWADFPEEDLEPIHPDLLLLDLTNQQNIITELLHTWDKGKFVRDGISTAIVGSPNVGKSTLMNLLAGDELSIVTDIPGTTRDIVRESVRLGGFVLHLADTAGLRDTTDPVESVGVERARQQLETADLVLAVFDVSEEVGPQDVALKERLCDKPCVAIFNKTDLTPCTDTLDLANQFEHRIFLSARTGEGKAELEAAVLQVLQLGDFDSTAAIVANQRQRACLSQAKIALDDAVSALESGITLDAVNLSIDVALDALLSLTGQRTSDTVLAEVFAKFCVGK